MSTILSADGITPLREQKSVESTLKLQGVDHINPEAIDDSLVFNTLAEYYYYSLHNFGYFMSRDIPRKFRKSSKEATEKFSTQEGIKAFESCKKIIYQKLKDEPVDAINPDEDYSELWVYYRDSILEFLAFTMDRVPKQFRKSNRQETEVHQMQSLSESMTKCIDVLREML